MIPMPGDLIFYPVTPRSGFVPRLIASVQLWRGEGSGKTMYSHVAIADFEPGWQFEAYVPRSRRSRIPDGRDVEVWRVRGALPGHAEAVLHWARTHTGQWYDLGRALFGAFKMAHSNICTTFVASAWQEAGFDLSAKAGRFVGPNELIDSGLLERVP